jgi:putative Mg2+ transporter-C (MgtC) family protein
VIVAAQQFFRRGRAPARATVSEVEYERRLDDKERVAVTLDVRLPTRVGMAALIERLETQPGIRRVQVQIPS